MLQIWGGLISRPSLIGRSMFEVCLSQNVVACASWVCECLFESFCRNLNVLGSLHLAVACIRCRLRCRKWRWWTRNIAVKIDKKMYFLYTYIQIIDFYSYRILKTNRLCFVINCRYNRNTAKRLPLRSVCHWFFAFWKFRVRISFRRPAILFFSRFLRAFSHILGKCAIYHSYHSDLHRDF